MQEPKQWWPLSFISEQGVNFTLLQNGKCASSLWRLIVKKYTFFLLFVPGTSKNAIFAIQIRVTKMESPTEIRLSPTRGAMSIGAATAGVMLLLSIFNLPVIAWFLFFGGIYFGMRTFRKVLGGIIVYSKALSVGFQTAFFASTILAFFTYVSTTLEPSLITAIVDAMEEQLITSAIPSGLVESMVQQWREALTPVVLAIITIFMYTAVGGIVGIILAFFVRNAKPGEFVEYRA